MTLLAEGSPWIVALGWALLHFLWQGAIVGGVFALLRASIPRHQCNARYANGLIALASMAILPVATFFTVWSREVVQVDVPPSAGAADAAIPVANVFGADASAAAAPLDGMLPWIVGAWLLGVVVVGVHSWRQWRVLAQVARRWADPDAGLQQIVAALAQRFDFVRQIRVLVSDRIDTPTLIGWLKPVILLPTAVAIGFPRQQVELILAHELGHLRRYDHLVNLAQAALETLLFYHPVVHWIAREVRNEREICCDTLVLRVVAGEPREYALTLAALEELRQPSARLALAANGGVLLERVRRILFVQHPVATQVGRRMWLPAVLTVAIALTAAAGINHTDAVQFEGPSSMPATVMPAATASSWAVSDIGSTRRLMRPKFVVAEPAQAPPVQAPSPPVADSMPAAASISLATIEQAPPVPHAKPSIMMESKPAVALGVSDIGNAEPAVRAIDVAASPKRMVPVALRTSAPEYPASARAGQSARVELRFSIAADGAVRDIGIVSEPADAAFARAARRALEQWRFDPATVHDSKARYRQAFVFALPGLADAGEANNGCVRRTGSRLCLRGENADVDGGEQQHMLSASRPGANGAAIAAGAANPVVEDGRSAYANTPVGAP